MQLLYGILMAMKKKKLEENFMMQVSLISVVTKMFVIYKSIRILYYFNDMFKFAGNLNTMHVS